MGLHYDYTYSKYLAYEYLWNDIEQAICNWVISSLSDYAITEMKKVIVQHELISDLSPKLNKLDDEFLERLLIFARQLWFNISELSKAEDVMYKELHKMKGDFRQYLLAEIGRTDCTNRANVLLSLISQDDTHSFTPIENSALFFNYTHPQIKMQETYVIIQY